MSLAKEGGTRPKECPSASVWVHKSYPRRSPLRNVSRIPVPPGHPLEPSLQGQSFRVPASRQVRSLGGRQGDSCLAFLGCWALWGRDRSEPLWASLPPSPEHQSRLTSPWGEVRQRWPFFPVALPHKVYFPVQKRKLSIFSYSLPARRPARPLPRVSGKVKQGWGTPPGFCGAEVHSWGGCFQKTLVHYRSLGQVTLKGWSVP